MLAINRLEDCRKIYKSCMSVHYNRGWQWPSVLLCGLLIRLTLLLHFHLGGHEATSQYQHSLDIIIIIVFCIVQTGSKYNLCTCSLEKLIAAQNIITGAKIIQLNEYGCRDAPCEKSWKQGNPLSSTIKDTSTIMRNPLPKLCREGYA